MLVVLSELAIFSIGAVFKEKKNPLFSLLRKG